MYKWFFAWRYLNTKLIAFFGIASVMLCVAMVLVVMSVMGGFLDTIRERSRGLLSEIVLDCGTAQGFPFYEEFQKYMADEKNGLADVVKVSTPLIYTYGIFRVPQSTYTKPAHVAGIRLSEYVQANGFKAGLHYERYYPGTTRLGKQSMPVAGVDDEGKVTLPKAYEDANKKWREAETDLKAIADFDRQPYVHAFFPDMGSMIAGERVYALGGGEPTYEGPEKHGIIVGCDLLNTRRVDGNFDRVIARGADIALSLLPLSPSGNPKGEPPVVVPMRYVDDSRTGIFEIDRMSVYVDFDMLQHKLAMDPQPRVGGGLTKPRASQLLIALHDGANLNDARDNINKAWSTFTLSIASELTDYDIRAISFVEAYTWEDLQRSFIAAVEKEKVLVTILFSLISMVAIVLIGCIFYMIVEKKTRDIGILKALGASGKGVATMFIAYAAAVGVFGSILGIAIGCAFVWNINDIQDLLASINPQLRVWSPDVYSFDKIPEVVKRADAIWIAIFAVLSSMLGSIIPAYIAGKIWPVNALRYE